MKKGTKTLKRVNSEHLSFNFNHSLDFFVKSSQNFQNTPVFIFLKENYKFFLKKWRCIMRILREFNEKF